MKAKMRIEWALAPHSVTLDALLEKSALHYFLYNHMIYSGSVGLISSGRGDACCYLVTALGDSKTTPLPGSTMVTPVTLESLTPLY